MNLRHLEHWLALADTGSFSRAAEKLHITQSALSRSIQALEEDLGAAGAHCRECLVARSVEEGN